MFFIGAAKSVAQKWAQNLPVHWTMSDLFPVGKEKTKTLVIKSIYQITIYLFDKIYIYIFFTFRYCKNKSLRLSDTVSLKYKNAKYITDQQQKKRIVIIFFPSLQGCFRLDFSMNLTHPPDSDCESWIKLI